MDQGHEHRHRIGQRFRQGGKDINRELDMNRDSDTGYRTQDIHLATVMVMDTDIDMNMTMYCDSRHGLRHG